MNERILDFIDFEEYSICTNGDVYSLKYGKRKLLKPSKNKDGYLQVALYKDRKRKCFRVHRLVAEAFIPNQYNLPQVNHKNEDKTDNRVSNLEWCDCKYNVNYGTRNERTAKSNTGKKVSEETKRKLSIANTGKKHSEETKRKLSETHINNPKQSKPVAQFTKEGTLIGIYPSTQEAERQGFHSSHIASCCRGERKSCCGYIWKWAE